MDERAAGGHDFLDLGEQLGHGGEAKRDSLERGLPQVARSRLEVEPADGAVDVRPPAWAPLAAEEREEGQPVVVGVAARKRRLVLVRAEQLLEPVVDVAAVRECAALQHAPLVDAVEEEAGARLRPLGLVEDAVGARGADHQRRALPRHAPGAEVRADAVEERGIPAAGRLVPERRQALRLHADRLEELRVPVAAREVEEPGAGGEGHRRLRPLAGQPLVEVVGERDEPRRRAEELRLLLGEPRELGRPVARVQVRARARVDGLRVEQALQPLGRVVAPRVAPREERAGRATAPVEDEQRVTERRGADGVDLLAPERLVDRVPNAVDDLVRVGGVVLAGRGLAAAPRVLVVH